MDSTTVHGHQGMGCCHSLFGLQDLGVEYENFVLLLISFLPCYHIGESYRNFSALREFH